MQTAIRKSKPAHKLRKTMVKAKARVKRVATHMPHLNMRKIKGKINKIYTHSLADVKQRPYRSLGILLGVSAISGVLMWMHMRK